MKTRMSPAIEIWHNIMWASYKGAVFSELHRLAQARGVDVRFGQIAETEGARLDLSTVDLRYHRYPYQLLFKGAHDAVPTRRLVSALFGVVWRSEADVIVIPGYHRPEYWAMLLAALLRGKAIAVFCDSTAFDRPRSLLKAAAKSLFFRLADRIFCYGERSRAYVTSFGIAPDKTVIRCQAAALPDAYSPAAALSMRQSLASETPYFLYVGRLAEEKNLEALISAMAIVRRTDPAAELVLVGHGPLRERLETLAAVGRSNAVKFVGAKTGAELAVEYAKATCLVLPSTSEPWGLVVNEAYAYGCPAVVSYRCGCVPELVENGIGLVSNDLSPEGLAADLLRARTLFADRPQVAQRCIEVAGSHSSAMAASQILAGCLELAELR